MAEPIKTDKTPLQDEKAQVVSELTQAPPDAGPTKQRGVKKGSKRGSYSKKKGPVSSPSITEPEYTPQDATRDADFLTALLNQLRQGAGIGPIKDKHAIFFKESSRQVFLKYGPSTTKWMPELMFAGSLFFIMLDTKAELKKLKLARAAKKKEAIKTAPGKGDKEGFVDLRGPMPPTDDNPQSSGV